MENNVTFTFIEQDLAPPVGTDMRLPLDQWPTVGDHLVIGQTCWLCVARLWHANPPATLELVLQRNGELGALRARRALHIATD